MIKEKETLSNTISPDMREVGQVIDKLSDDTSPVAMKNSLYYEHKDIIRKDLVQKNDTKENNEVKEISIET